MGVMEEVKELLEKAEGGADQYEKLVNHIDEAGREASRKANGEAHKLRQRMKEAEDKAERFEGGMKRIGFEDGDLGDFLDGIEMKLAGKGEKKSTESPEYKTLSRKFDELNTKFETTEKERQTLQARTRNDRITSVLSKALKDEKGNDKIYGPDLFIKNLINDGRVSLDDDEKNVSFIDGDNRISLDDGLKAELETRKDLLKNPQSPGGGSSGGGPDSPGKKSDIDRLREIREQNRSPVLRTVN